ncbi:terminase small subunit [Hymenobacter sp. M29]|uniref:Terminase small subunit n=1 Tax=Hymenobacter mellowenesis TaxID=3063995 RepID=A0ABT9AJ68_9BACT|nr:terminase small subunit [Hymenobacter sp. M29]MDO7849915.1 terminase small subunit [Hymenobacter sp. M29]
MSSEKSALSPKQLSFAKAYAGCLNATRAALSAGYSEKTARSQGSRLLTNVDIQAEIKKLLSHSGLSPEEIAARWDRIATVDLSDFYTKQPVEYTPRISKPLAQIVEECRADVEFEEAYAIRCESLITEKKLRETFRKRMKREALKRETYLLRLEMELEQNPDAVRIVAGPTVLRDELRLDLVKAEALGVLDLVKSITEGRGGTSFTLRDPDAALDNLAKWRGMLTTKLDVTSDGLPVMTPLRAAMSPELKKQLLDARRAAAAAQKGPADA